MGKKYQAYIKDKEMIDFIERQIENGNYRNYSHLFESAVRSLTKKEVEI